MYYLSTSGARENLQTITSVFLKSTFGFFGDIYVIIVAGIYFTVDPLLYQRGMIRLLPPFRRERMNDAVEKMGDRKSTRLNSSHVAISYAVFCLKKKKQADAPNPAERKTRPKPRTASAP